MHSKQSSRSLYKIYMISQVWDDISFNRGLLLNVGFEVASTERNWDCYILHDVDLLPASQDNDYRCAEQVRVSFCGLSISTVFS